MTLMELAILGGMVGTVAICILLLTLGGGKRRKIRQERARKFQRYNSGSRGASSNETTTVKRAKKNEKRWLAGIISLLPKKDKLERLLIQTGKNISISQFLLMSFGLIVATIAVTKIVFGMPLPLSVLLGAAAGPSIMGLALKIMIGKRTTAFLVVFPDAIDLMVRGLKAGLPIGEAIASIGREFEGPVAEEFNQVTEAVRIGATLSDALWQACERMPVQDLKFLVISLSIQQETGGNLSETLGNLSNILRRRKTMKLKIKALSSEARASAYILGSLPFVLFFILLLIASEYALVLVEDPRGQKVAGIGLVLIGIAAFTMARMVRFRI